MSSSGSSPRNVPTRSASSWSSARVALPTRCVSLTRSSIHRPRLLRSQSPAAIPSTLPQRLVLVGSLTPDLDPLVGPGESDSRPLRRPLAQLAEEEGESAAQPLAGSASDPLHDLLCQLVAEEAAAVQHVPDSRPNCFD